jgi:putative drug exporter of the RND superfamily
MIRSEFMSWPLTRAVLVVVFGSLAAAGIPLLLSISGLAATAGTLWLGTHLLGISIWAMNFALMFALAVGIDYALFVVVRFRSALGVGLRPVDAVAETMDTAGKTVLVSGLAVLASLSAVMLVPSQPFRTSAMGIPLAVGFVLAASLTLLPAVLASLGSRIDRFALPWAGAVQHRSESFARWGRLIWRHPVLVGAVAAALLVALAAPVLGLRTAMPSTGVLPGDTSARLGHERMQRAFGLGRGRSFGCSPRGAMRTACSSSFATAPGSPRCSHRSVAAGSGCCGLSRPPMTPRPSSSACARDCRPERWWAVQRRRRTISSARWPAASPWSMASSWRLASCCSCWWCVLRSPPRRR